MKIMGIDLAGKDDNPTGMCILNQDNIRDNNGSGGTPPGCEIYTLTVYTNEEILDFRNPTPRIIKDNEK